MGAYRWSRTGGSAAVLLLTALGSAAWAAQSASAALSWGTMIMGVCGGLALFLLGMERMTEALKAVAGDRLQTILARLTSNRFSGALVGALTTAVIQSSSVTTVLVVGFVSAGVMTLSQAIGVIMGANIGTTITAQIIAFKITRFALAFIALGFALLMLGRSERLRQQGGILLGLGMVFFGMQVMSEAMIPLRDYQPFIGLMMRMEAPLLGILVGALFTALVQSSSATTGIVIVLASQGFMTLPAGIAVALGANIGTCLTAVLAALGKPRPAVQAAVVHVVFNLAGALLWLLFVEQLADLAVAVSPRSPELSGMARLAAETPRQIANANTLFNLINTVLFIGFTPFMAQFVARLLPEHKEPESGALIRPKYLDEQLLGTPSAALHLVRMELGELGSQVARMMKMSRIALEKPSEKAFLEIEKADDAADILHSAIMAYLNQLGKRELTDDQAQDYFRLTQAADTLERIGDILETDLTAQGLTMLRQQLHPSATTLHILGTLHRQVAQALDSAINAVTHNDAQAAQEVLALRRTINEAVEAAFRRQASSLASSAQARLQTLQLEFEVTDKLKQIYSLCKRIARLLVPREV